jgi:hypothetical protein
MSVERTIYDDGAPAVVDTGTAPVANLRVHLLDLER